MIIDVEDNGYNVFLLNEYGIIFESINYYLISMIEDFVHKDSIDISYHVETNINQIYYEYRNDSSTTDNSK